MVPSPTTRTAKAVIIRPRGGPPTTDPLDDTNLNMRDLEFVIEWIRKNWASSLEVREVDLPSLLQGASFLELAHQKITGALSEFS